MTSRLDKYLTQVYRRDVIGKPTVVEMPEPDPKLMAEIEAEIARIDGLHLGAHLANRDFVSYQNRRALLRLRDQLKAQQQQEEKHGHEPA
jgi:hypothetical protein